VAKRHVGDKGFIAQQK